MSTKSQVLTLLMKQTPAFLSGEEMAQRLSLSRTAIWKAINELKKMAIKLLACKIRGIALKNQMSFLQKAFSWHYGHKRRL